MVNFTVLDLFSGIGGFSLGLERAGMHTVAFCENDPFCRKVLAKHWPDVPIHDNIEELDGRQYRGTVELVCGGFPCQPFSVTGEQRGAEDDRALWPEMLRVIREVEPAWIIGENVTGIINMELDNCLSSLEDSGYSCQTFVIPACAVDAQHRRDRVWIIASHANCKSKPDGSEELDVADTHINERGRGRCSESQGRETWVEHWSGSSGQPERETDSLMADTDSGLGNQQKEQIQAGRNAANSSGENVGESISEGLEGYPWDVERGDKPRRIDKNENRSTAKAGVRARKPRRWLPEPNVGRVAHGIPRRVDRLKSLGNAVLPQVVEVLGKAIIEIENLR